MKALFTLSPNIHKSLLLATAFCLVTLSIRVWLTHSLFYSFLVWNLFLAAVPYCITQAWKYSVFWRKHSAMQLFLFCSWLLFLPNSPYIITDLVHLHNEHSILVWLDLFLVFVFALLGLLFGLLSLMDMHDFIQIRLSRKATALAIAVLCFLCGYGVYLGRFLRFNSWDILTKPLFLAQQIVQSLVEPKVLAMSLAFGGLFWVFFLVFRSFWAFSKDSPFG
ncbi:MAG: DUF1361 domain-containing protein [Bacteroidota bacterium]